MGNPPREFLFVLGFGVVLLIALWFGGHVYKRMVLQECHYETILDIGGCNERGSCRVETQTKYMIVRLPIVGGNVEVCEYRKEQREWLRWLVN